MDYAELVGLYEALGGMSKRLGKTFLISRILKKAKKDELEQLCLLVQGRIFPVWDERKIGVASKIVVKALVSTCGVSAQAVEVEWRKRGDLGLVAEALLKRRRQNTLFSETLSVKKVFSNLQKLPDMEGKGAVDRKLALICELLSSASPLEARYLVGNVVETLRLGVADGTLRDAIVWAFLEPAIVYDEDSCSIEVEDRDGYNALLGKVQSAFDTVNDWGEVARIAKEEKVAGLLKVQPRIGKPLKVMLYPKAKDVEDAFSIVGRPAAFEFKYDGFRIQVHVGKGIRLFTRRLEEVTVQFPDVVRAVESSVNGKNLVLDAEVIGIDVKKGGFLPFQSISQRIRRKYDIEMMAEKFPVEVHFFDILIENGKSVMEKGFKERRVLLKRVVSEKKGSIRLAEQCVTDDVKIAEEFYERALKAGQEGVMAKNLEGIYKPGSRVGYGVKIKPVMETLDVVILGGEWGEGKRSGWITSLLVGVREGDGFLAIGKVGTGLKELEGEELTFAEVTELLRPLVVSEEGKVVKVEPKVIIEVAFEEIQKSPTYESGFALRFPRVRRLRDDRGVKDMSTLDDLKRLFDQQ
ncbi:DNA ligase [Candidatus Woesearchaeota archaeon]|nr:DNA ligase [Candidatus Woesearchaeota archaeon]